MAQGAQSLSAMGKLRAWPDEKSDEERSRTARSRSRDRASRRSERTADLVADVPAKAAPPKAALPTAQAVAAVADASANAAEHRTPTANAPPSDNAESLPPRGRGKGATLPAWLTRRTAPFPGPKTTPKSIPTPISNSIPELVFVAPAIVPVSTPPAKPKPDVAPKPVPQAKKLAPKLDVASAAATQTAWAVLTPRTANLSAALFKIRISAEHFVPYDTAPPRVKHLRNHLDSELPADDPAAFISEMVHRSIHRYNSGLVKSALPDGYVSVTMPTDNSVYTITWNGEGNDWHLSIIPSPEGAIRSDFGRMFARLSDARKGYAVDSTYTGGRIRAKKRRRSDEEASSSIQPKVAATEAEIDLGEEPHLEAEYKG